MNLNMWLPWFPIVLATGVGARLLGPGRGIGLGLLCALFWVAMVHASEGLGVWGHSWNVAVMVSGSLAIVAIGAWSNEAASRLRSDAAVRPTRGSDATGIGATGSLPARVSEGQEALAGKPLVAPIESLCAAIEQFDDWLEDHRNDADPWPEFGEFVRGVLYRCCGAVHVRFYRILSEGDELVPIREADPFCEPDWRSARVGLVGHVATTGRSYLASDSSQGELITRLAKESDEPLAWVFAIARGARKIGVATIGQVHPHCARSQDQPAMVRSIECLVSLFWNSLVEACRGRSAGTRDPVSGLLTRESFFASADHSLQQAYRQGEPVVVAIIALEQLRHLSDTGRWEVADELVREVSTLMQRKVRSDDKIGRFDGTRFLLLLRRVDSHLATLILDQLMLRMASLCADPSRWGVSVQARCGVSGSGMEEPPLTSMVTQALRLCHEARINEVNIASDLDGRKETVKC